MFKRIPRPALLACVIVQLLIVMGVIAQAAWPIWTGRPIRLQAEPMDPRDLLRGQYVAFNYGFTTLNNDELPKDFPASLRFEYGDVLYLVLADSGGVHKPTAMRLQPPADDTLFLKVQFREPRHPNGTFYLEAGLEAYYTTPEDAIRIEQAMRWNPQADTALPVYVLAKVATDGQARMVGVDIPAVKKP